MSASISHSANLQSYLLLNRQCSRLQEYRVSKADEELLKKSSSSIHSVHVVLLLSTSPAWDLVGVSLKKKKKKIAK